MTIRPPCHGCGHSNRRHGEGGKCLSKICGCLSYVWPPVSVRRSAIPRKAQPLKRKAKLLPKCKHCAHPGGKHSMLLMGGRPLIGFRCERCEACPGYEPAIGIRQKRRTPSAAVKRIADGLWTRIVHARPGGCEIQQYHVHTCKGGYQGLHGIPRTFNATRHLPINGFKGCAGVHKFFTERPEAWSALLLEAWGLETFRELWALARASQPVDMDATVQSLRADLARMEG